jgi:hypothetical protein
MNKSERLSKNIDIRKLEKGYSSAMLIPELGKPTQEGLFILPENITPKDLEQARPTGQITKKGGYSFGYDIRQ